ncbi:MAG: SMC family ATPase, partial [Sulfolobales archaeon]
EIVFGRGLTAIVGPNGAGKSSIVEAILLALFDRGGQSSQEIIRTGRSKRGVVRIGSQWAAIELEFEAGGRVYRVRREYDGEGNSRNHYLEEISGGSRKLLARGVSDVTEYIASNILGAKDPLVFTSTIFSRQDMLAQFLEMSARDRWEKILRMMGLEDLERARELAKEAADKADKMLAEIARDEQNLRDLRDRLARDKADAARLRQELQIIDSKISEAEARRKDLEERIGVLRKAIEKIEMLVTLEQLERELGGLENELRISRNRLDLYRGLGLDRDSVMKLYDTYRRSIQCGDKRVDIERRVKSYSEEIDRLRRAPQDLKGLAKSLGIEIEEISQEVLDMARKTYEDLSRRLGEVRGSIATYTRLLELRPEGGRCPFCGRELGAEDARHIIERHRVEVDRLRREEASLEELARRAGKLYRDVEEALSKIRSYRSKVEELSKELEDLRACVEEGMAICSRISDIAGKIFPGEPRSCGDILKKMAEELGSLLERIERAEKRVKELEDLRIRERISSLRRELEDLLSSSPWLKGVSEYRGELARAEAEAREIQRHIEDLKRRRGSIEGELSRLEKIVREREEKISELEKRISMKPSLEKSLKILRVLEKSFFGREGLLSQILTQIVARRLEEEVNRALEAFSRPFRVSIESDFNIAIRSHGGALLGLNSLSGGERTMLAIAFRIALAKTLLGRLPGVMILDEPTQNLDVENKARLFEMVREIAGMLEQVIVVTHDEEIIGRADNIVRVYNEGGVSVVDLRSISRG